MSTFCSAKCSKANAVVASKKVIELSIKVCLWFSIKFIIFLSDIGKPSILILSLKFIKWGEVYNPTL